MNESTPPPQAAGWLCARCDVSLEMRKVNIAYLGSMFPVDLPKCPRCGQVFIPEELAMGKMAQVEEILEDK